MKQLSFATKFSGVKINYRVIRLSSGILPNFLKIFKNCFLVDRVIIIHLRLSPGYKNNITRHLACLRIFRSVSYINILITDGIFALFNHHICNGLQVLNL